MGWEQLFLYFRMNFLNFNKGWCASLLVFGLTGTFLACGSRGRVESGLTAAPGRGAPSSSRQPSSDGSVQSFYEGVSDRDLKEESAKADFVDDIIGNEVEDEIASSDLNQVSKPDVPIVLNRQVEKWLNYFQGRGRKFFARWLARSGRYIPMMQRILQENGLPDDLVYLAMIESGFKPYAYSRARASGPWQFIRRTGSRYGLRVNWWIDERRDPEKSTIAAAQHLKDLHDQFDHWYLAAAGYNAGAGKISRAIKRYSTEDFWEISKFRYLRSETKNYVPKLIAASLIAKNPRRHGFENIRYQTPLEYDKVPAPKPVQLAAVARAMKISRKKLVELNPELRRGMTPPRYPSYELKIPRGYSEKFAEIYPKLKKEALSDVVRHRVRRGQTLSGIANRYGVHINKILAFNQLRSRHKLRAGQTLVIPVRGSKATKPRARKKRPSVAKAGSYMVQDGDTLWSISRRFDVSVSELKSWNRIRNPQRLMPGSRLRVVSQSKHAFIGPSTKRKEKPGWTTYRVRRGDTLWGIARRHQIQVADLARWNQLDLQSSILYPGLQLKIRALNL